MAIRDLGLPPHEPERPYLVSPRKHPRWKRIVAWTAGILLALVIVVVAGVYVLLHSQKFHDYLLSVAETKTGAALNTQVQLQNFALHLSPPALDLYGVTVYGVGPGAGRPLLEVDRIGLGLRIISILHRQWNLDRVTVNHPVANLIVAANGQTNLPTSGNSNTSVFDLAIRHVVLDRGVVYYNDRETPLYADLSDLEFQSSYSSADNGQYFGTLSYRDGHLQYGSYAPIQHDLKAQFNARRDGMTLSNVKLTTGSSQVLLNASLDDYASPRVHAKYVVILSLAELRNVMHSPTVPSGVVVVNGIADYNSAPGRAALDTTSLQGTVHSRVLQVRTASLRTDIRDLDAAYTFANGNVELRGVSAQLLGGSFRANATVRNVMGNQQGHIVATVRGISLGGPQGLGQCRQLETGRHLRPGKCQFRSQLERQRQERSAACRRARESERRSRKTWCKYRLRAAQCRAARALQRPHPGNCSRQELHPDAADLAHPGWHGERALVAAGAAAGQRSARAGNRR